MAVLVRLGRHVMSANDTGSFLSMTYGSALVHVKRNYDKLMHAHLKSIQDVKIVKKNKCGILPFVANFEVNTIKSYKLCLGYFYLSYNIVLNTKKNIIVFVLQIILVFCQNS